MKIRFVLPILGLALCFAFAPAQDAKALGLVHRMWYGHGIAYNGCCGAPSCGSCCDAAPSCCEPSCCAAPACEPSCCAAPSCCEPSCCAPKCCHRPFKHFCHKLARCCKRSCCAPVCCEPSCCESSCCGAPAPSCGCGG